MIYKPIAKININSSFLYFSQTIFWHLFSQYIRGIVKKLVYEDFKIFNLKLNINILRYGLRVPLTDAENGVEQTILSIQNIFK